MKPSLSKLKDKELKKKVEQKVSKWFHEPVIAVEDELWNFIQSAVEESYEKGYQVARDRYRIREKHLLDLQKKEIIKRVKVHFETMMFDDTRKDKLSNIMEFRKEQSEYLDDLLSKLEGEK